MRLRDSVKVIAVLAALLPALLIGGCSSGSYSKTLDGDYRAEYDSTYILENIFEQEGYEVEAEGVIITPYRLSVKEGKFTLEMDLEGYEKSFTEYLDKNIDKITDAMVISYGFGDDDESKEEFIGYTTFDTFDEFKEYMKADFIATMGFDSMTPQTKTGNLTSSGCNIKFKTDEDYEFSGLINDDGTITVEGADVSPLEFSRAG